MAIPPFYRIVQAVVYDGTLATDFLATFSKFGDDPGKNTSGSTPIQLASSRHGKSLRLSSFIKVNYTVTAPYLQSLAFCVTMIIWHTKNKQKFR